MLRNPSEACGLSFGKHNCNLPWICPCMLSCEAVRLGSPFSSLFVMCEMWIISLISSDGVRLFSVMHYSQIVWFVGYRIVVAQSVRVRRPLPSINL